MVGEVNPQHFTVGQGSTMGAGEPVISDAVRLGDLVFLSGRAPVDPATLQPLEGGFDVQARSVIADIDAVLEASGSSRGLVLRVECFLADPQISPRGTASGRRPSRPRGRPARRSSPGSRCPGILIELQVTAGIGRSQ